MYIHLYTLSQETTIYHQSTNMPICAAPAKADPDEPSQLRRFFTKIFGKSPVASLVYPSPPRMSTRYAPRKRWICESQGWIMADAVHRCKRGVVRRSEARWLGRICETIIESARAHALGEEEERRRRCVGPRNGDPQEQPSVLLLSSAVHAEWVSYDDIIAHRDDEQAGFLSRVMTDAFWIRH